MKSRIIQIVAPSTPVYVSFSMENDLDHYEPVQLWALVVLDSGETVIKGMSGEGMLRFSEESPHFCGYTTKLKD